MYDKMTKALILVLMLLLLLGAAAAKKVVSCTDINSDCGKGVCMLPVMTQPDHLICECDKGYISVTKPCDYFQKSQLVAFLLSFFLGEFGADWFYLANGSNFYIGIGVLKMLLLSMGCACCPLMAGCGLLCTKFCPKNCTDKVIGPVILVFFIFLQVTIFVWWITDWIRTLTGDFHDGNGHELLSFVY